MLNAERIAVPSHWDGNLDHFTTRASSRPGQLAAMVVAESGHARAWMNLRLCHAQDWPLIWLRLRRAAVLHACTLLWADDLAVLAADDDREQLGA